MADMLIVHWLKWPLLILIILVLLGIALWGGFALWFQLPAAPWLRVVVIAVWGLAGLVALATLCMRHLEGVGSWPMGIFAVGVVAIFTWWGSITPSHERIWADDVAQLLDASIDGEAVTLRNVRNFTWRSETDYDAHWETRQYDLRRLVSADLLLSYWMGPAIAHTLVSFGFDDGRRVVFSLEIRKERGEKFSAIGGFFRQFEAVIVAADERDIVRTRTNARGEDVWLYRLNIPPALLRKVFLGYLERASELKASPRFYNTLTSNCTTIVFELARLLSPGLPLDYRLLASGYFADYAYDNGGLVPGYSFDVLKNAGRITERALAADRNGEDYSHAIRVGVPGE